MQVRLAEPADYAEAGRVTAAAYGEFARPGDPGWDRYLAEIADVAGRADRTLVLVAVEEARILGSATLELEDTIGDEGGLGPGEANLRMLGVDPEARGRGAGRALVEACVEISRLAGKASLTLRTTERMRAARELYRSTGFDRDPRRDHLVPNGPLLVAFRLALG